MVRSMTGFGRCVETVDGLNITVEIKSVNHRYFEFSSRLSRAYQFAEEPLKSLLAKSITRGKVELSVFVEDNTDKSTQIEINHQYVKPYVEALRKLAKEYKIKDDLKLSAIAGNQELLVVKKTTLDDEVVINALKTVTEKALVSYNEMRETEGEKLKADVLSRTETILSAVEFIESRSPETVKAYRERIEEKMRDLLNGAAVDEQRLLTETAIFADKVAVDEETVRLRSHISQLKTMLDGTAATGKKLDFLIQEMNREANTIGSKSQNLEIAHTVVDIKAEIEKIREQIQNIE
ncbi:MAG: YicC family protein [Clostridia bacterium]|nr:YicC family protein [Clostridia bacterium]